MTAEIVQFKPEQITLSAVCNACEESWTAEMPLSRYTLYIKTNKRCICPFCGDYDTGMARKVN